MKIFEWKRISGGYETYLDIMFLGSFCLLRESIWCNDEDVVKHSSIIKINVCDLSKQLIDILEEKPIIGKV